MKKEGKLNLLTKIRKIVLAKQRTNTINLKGTGVKEVQIIEKKEKVEKTVTKDWRNTLHAQRNAKFALLGRQKIKKYKLTVEKGDKLFIQKEAEEEIIYNDDYNSRKEKPKSKDQNENEQKKQIVKEKEVIKEKEIVPRYKREVRAQISRLKESESETSSSISEIDVLAAIKNQRMMKKGIATGSAADIGVIGYKKTADFRGYQTKVINGEVTFTAKNTLGVNLGGAEYQKRITSKTGYTKKYGSINGNKISGIEIVNPNEKSEIYYQKMTGASGAIADGNYKIIGTNINNTNDKGLSGSISCKQMKIITKTKNMNMNNIPNVDLNNNGQTQSFRKQVIITSKTESTQQKGLNGSPSSNVILKKRTKDSKNSGCNNSIIKDSPNSGNNIPARGSQNSGINKNNTITQQISSGKVIFNSRLKTEGSEKSQQSIGAGPGQNKTISTTRQYEMRIKTSDDKNEKIITENKKITEVKLKNNKRTKNVQLLRDDNF